MFEPSPDGVPRLMTVAEAAERLRICEKTLRRHIGSGELACIALGRGPDRRRRLIHPDDLRAFIDRMREGGGGGMPVLSRPARRRRAAGPEAPPEYNFTKYDFLRSRAERLRIKAEQAAQRAKAQG